MRLSGISLTFSFCCSLLCCAAAAFAETPFSYGNAVREAIDLSSHGENTQAEVVLRNAAANAVREKQLVPEAAILGVLGAVYQRTGDYLQAEDALNRSISQWSSIKGPDIPELVGPLANLGGLYYEAGQFAHAEKLLSRALKIENATDKQPGLTATIQINLGNVIRAAQRQTGAKTGRGIIEKLRVDQ